MFRHLPKPNLPKLELQEINGMRYYKTPSGVLIPSVTTILSTIDKPELRKWKAKVGEAESKRVSKHATDRGHLIHNLCEKYLNNEKIDRDSIMPNIWAVFVKLKPFLNKLNDIRCLETSLYSEKLQIAGTVDCIATYNDTTLVVCDFKGSNKKKTIEQIPGYCLQVTAYAELYKEHTGIEISDAIIAMTVEQDNPSIFHIQVLDYRQLLFETISKFFINNSVINKDVNNG